jgi:uncharacterized protein (TIGR03437 family)
MYWRAWLLALLAFPAAWSQTASDLFDENVFHDIRITINPADWKRLQDNYLDNTYYPANFTWRGKTVENVGIRSKGRTSRRPNKPGLRVDFNRFEDGQEFLGLKSVLLDSNIQDLTLIKERLTMRIFEMMGIPAPKESNCRLFVKTGATEEYIGVYAIVESTDKRFLKDRLGEDDGYLYEYVTYSGYRFDWRGEDVSFYSPNLFKPETHELDPDPKPVMEMVRAINTPGTDAEWLNRVGAYLDVKKFLTHLAVEMYVAEFDGILADDGMANFYFYRFEKKNLGMFLPKDKDLAFSLIEYLPLKNLDQNVLTKRALAIPEMKEHFAKEILRAADLVSGEGGWLQTQINRDYGQIREAMLLDKNKECIGATSCSLEQSNADFEKSIDYLKRFALERRAELVRQLTAAGFITFAPGAIQVTSVVNAASSQGGAVAPGEFVSIYGTNLGPASAAIAQGVEKGLGAVRVSFNGIEAYMTYASTTQINAVVPYGVKDKADVIVSFDGKSSDSFALAVADSAPGIFTKQYGAGPAWAVNAGPTPQFNAAETPVSRGGAVSFWATGQGAVDPAGQDGEALSTWKALKLPVKVTVGGVEAPVLWSGLIYTGEIQVNAAIPANAPVGEVELVVTIGNASSRKGVTLAVK